MKATLAIIRRAGTVCDFAHIRSIGRDPRYDAFYYYGHDRKRRSTAIRDGLKFADAHNITITNRKEFER